MDISFDEPRFNDNDVDQSLHKINKSRQSEKMVFETVQGRVAIVTGASSGIGAAIAEDLARRGCRLSLCGRDYERLISTRDSCVKSAQDFQQENDILLISSDLAKDEDLEKIVERTVNHFGRVDILINNAGVARVHAIEDLTMEEYRLVMRVNLDVPVFLSKLCVPHLEKTKGCIINISSNAAKCAFPGSLAYCLSKAAVDHLTRCLALELAPKGIRVNAVNPGLVPTEIFKNAGFPDFVVDQILSDRNAVNCLGRCGRLDDLTGLVHFLTSEGAAYTTGAIVMVNGGWDNQCFRYEYDTGLLADDNGNTTDLADLKSEGKVIAAME